MLSTQHYLTQTSRSFTNTYTEVYIATHTPTHTNAHTHIICVRSQICTLVHAFVYIYVYTNTLASVKNGFPLNTINSHKESLNV